jgi:flagellin
MWCLWISCVKYIYVNAGAGICAVTTISKAISIINAERVDLVALSNQFQSTTRNLYFWEFLAAKRSICDTNFAAETPDLTGRHAVQRPTATTLGWKNRRAQIFWIF